MRKKKVLNGPQFFDSVIFNVCLKGGMKPGPQTGSLIRTVNLWLLTFSVMGSLLPVDYASSKRKTTGCSLPQGM